MTDKTTEDDDLELETKPNEVEDKKKKLSEEYKDLLAAMVEEQLKEIKADFKAKQDKAYKQLEAEKKERIRIEEEAKEAKRRKLEDEGNHLELAKLKLAEVEERNKILEEKLVRTSRDSELNRALGNLDFRNEFARSTAFNAIVSELIQDEDGLWIHKSGAPLTDYVKTFVKDPDKSFLFKTKENSGAGTTNNKGQGKSKRPDSLEGLSSAELLKLVENGELGSWTL